MAATKRSLADTEAEAEVTTKKQKVKDLAVGGDVDSDEVAELKKQKKKEKKERKKEKKDKKDKKSKSAAAADQDGEAPAAAAAAEEAKAETEEEKAERKRQKKEKKRKEKEAAAQSSSSNNNGSAAVPVVTASGPTPTAAVLGGYQQAAALTALPQSEVDAFLTAENITVTDPVDNPTALRPILEFSYLPETDLIKKKPFSAYKKPTPIQSASWPYTLSRRDVIGVAETGSGKTMAFALPLVEGISKIKKRCIKAVVVSPTRELAMQTQEQMEHVSSLLGLKSICIYGGASKDDQRALLRRGADVIVATPGRLKDFMMDGTISLQDVKFAVLDEADRMLDKGFEEDIKMILGDMPAREARQTVMFTATWPASVRKLAESFMVDPVKVTIGSSGKETANGAVELQANTRITQRVEVVDPRAKEQRLLQLLKQWQATASQKNDRILVFCLYKKEATRVEAFLQQRGIRVGGIHGDLRQEQRTRSLEAFKAGTTPVLVATDVAARGLDIPEVKLVINVTFPLTIEDYVHRIGRTGRAGKTGEAITLFTEHDKAHSGSLINILKGAKQPVPDELFKFGTTVKKKAHSTYGAFFKDVDMTKKATKITFD
ncbi:DEAD/DEAH box helicase [Colletotrichum graminicola]|uniref:RNA helicase n=1 Tax=Colletotrichum graminicola (strain M1.001 / M2 / FGSC 10212) TaxID=645133 RepID=E3QT89_COLGM|nr:DEAD/DEAH box helicase [Colletotrichum graminicola M1.001]EFQ34077.1 DEAD/DEAH box helicase [Colletotrichum graminicola M1.001]WDK20849.1 DEAD/DEAH box helicase [Colletotrichum graminicola]